jgi:hypothetical protein
VHSGDCENNNVQKQLFREHDLWLVRDSDLLLPTNRTIGHMATLFLAPYLARPGTQKYFIQLNTIKALCLLAPEIQFVLFSTDPETRRALTLLSVKVIDNVETNPHGTPFLGPMFKNLEADFSVRSNFIGYLNHACLSVRDLAVLIPFVGSIQSVRIVGPLSNMTRCKKQMYKCTIHMCT